MEYQYIVNPKTGRKCNINGKLGREVIRNYAQKGGMFKFGAKGRERNRQEAVAITKANVENLRELIAEHKTNRNYSITLGQGYEYNYRLVNRHGGKDFLATANYDMEVTRDREGDMERKGCKPYKAGETLTMKLKEFKKVKADNGEVQYLPLYYLNHFVENKLKQKDKGDVYVYIFEDIKTKRDIAILNKGMWARFEKRDEVYDGVVRFADSDMRNLHDGINWKNEKSTKGGQIKVFYDKGKCFNWGYKKTHAALHYELA